MNIQTTTTTTRLLTEGDNEFELSFEPADYLDHYVVVNGDVAHVGYLVLDEDSRFADPSDDDCAPEFIRFDNRDEREEWVHRNLVTCQTCWGTNYVHTDEEREAAEADGYDPACLNFEPRFEWTPTTWWVERYEHGLVKYALMGESSYVDRRWDVASGVAVLKIEPTEWGTADWTQDRYEDAAREWLANYTSWCNGDVYGVVVEEYKREGDTWTQVDHDACWGYVGSDYAELVLKDEMPAVEVMS